MVFPNVYVAVNGSSTYVPSMYFKNGEDLTYSVSISNTSVASCIQEGNKLAFKGLATGQTAAVITASDGTSMSFTVTVRNNAAGNGWL